ncbi:unnamed protein product [Ambrosiozyma monospora]|uniref:Unnamed protein product n=1 Tax=Ambrosiozyma monospora TaxID=43982 RepID=A0ACB5TB72_AMBMO|nr:unnamed protein product [Ambrosiozyma monospora]
MFTAGQPRVVDGAKSFAQGFFGNGYSGDYQLVVLPEFEAQGANSLINTDACTNFDGDTNPDKVVENENLQYAQSEADRLNQLAPSYNLTASDIFTMVDYCAFELNVSGYSKFCNLLTPNAFVAYAYHNDLYKWYSEGPDLSPNEIDFKRAFKVSEIVPMGARINTERLSCVNSTSGETNSFVRLLLNDQVGPVPDCADGHGFSCPLNDYV